MRTNLAETEVARRAIAKIFIFVFLKFDFVEKKLSHMTKW